MPTRQQLADKLIINRTLDGNTHTLEAIYSVLNSILTEYGEPTDEIADIEDLYNSLWEVCDSQTPIYNSDLMDWFATHPESMQDYSNNVGLVGETIDELGIFPVIAQAYCWTLEQDAMFALTELYNSFTIPA